MHVAVARSTAPTSPHQWGLGAQLHSLVTDKQECALLIIDCQPENTGAIQSEKTGLNITITSTQSQVNTKKPRHAPRTEQRTSHFIRHFQQRMQRFRFLFHKKQIRRL